MSTLGQRELLLCGVRCLLLALRVPRSDCRQGKRLLLDILVFLFADLTLCDPTQCLPCRLVPDGAAVRRENLQQQVAQFFFSCLSAGDGR